MKESKETNLPNPNLKNEKCDVCAGLHLNPGLHQVQPERERLPHEHIRVVALVESLLQLLQLPAREVRPRPSPFAAGTVLIWVSGICRRVHACIQVCLLLRERERERFTILLQNDTTYIKMALE